ncbi:MAG: hypothetical protein ABI675_13740 [Chitinophagaceae bacterium]
MNIRTGTGFECFGKFFLGNRREFATTIFNQLKGEKNIDEKGILQFDLVESINGLPASIQVISCSLEELAENCKFITKETFKVINMEEI